MPISRKLLAVTGVLAASALALTGCSASGSSPSAGSTVAAAADINSCKPADTTLNTTYGIQATESMKIAVAALEKKYPGLKINATPSPTSSYDDLTKTVVGDIAVGKRPDVIMTGLGQLKFWVDTYKPAVLDTAALPSTYKKQYLAAGTVDGKVYLAPSQISTPVLMVNQTALTAAGGGKASDIKTIAQLEKAAELVTAKTGKPSISVPTTGLSDWLSQAFVQGSGATFVKKDGTAGFDSDKAIKALSIWQDLKKKNLEMGVSDTDGLAAFGSGQAAFFVYTTSVIALEQKSIGSKFDWAAVDLPTLDEGDTGALPAGGNGWIVLSKNACSAAFSNALVAQLLSPKAAAAASGTSYSYIPVDTTAAKQLLASKAATPQLTYAWSYDKDLTPWGGFDGSKTVQVNDLIRTMAEKLQSGSDTASTVKSTVASINALVGKK
jgi:multiple sugar transport system substrate-binding protein